MLKYTQGESDFNIPMVREARGIIFRDYDYKCVCRGFDKFGNYGESYCPTIDWQHCTVQEKIDGSLIKVWWDNGYWHVSTNGTIDAFKAELTDNLKYKTFGELFTAAMPINLGGTEFNRMASIYCTYLFELVSPYNRVVIPYKETKLYFLGWRADEKANYIEHSPALSCLSRFFDTPKTYDLHNLEQVKEAAEQLPWDEEGYVVCDSNFNRVKIKSPRYVEAHYARNNNTITLEKLVQVVLDKEQAEFLIYASDHAEELKRVEEAMDYVAATAVTTMQDFFGGAQFFASKQSYATDVQRHPWWMQDFLFKCNTKWLFYAYTKAQGWTARKWATLIEELCLPKYDVN